jgi:hypothetical protein
MAALAAILYRATGIDIDVDTLQRIWHLSVMRSPSRAPASSTKGAAPCAQQYFKRNALLDQRLDDAAARLRKGAHGTSPGVERERFICRACPDEPTAQIDWLASPGLRPDK